MGPEANPEMGLCRVFPEVVIWHTSKEILRTLVRRDQE